MARFYGEVQGSASTVASRIGRDKITGHIRGWSLGAEVTLFVNDAGHDELVVRITGGSDNPNEGHVVYHDSTTGDEKLLHIGSEIRFVLTPKKIINFNQTD